MYDPIRKEAEKLYDDPVSYACAMSNHELEKVIFCFVTELLARTGKRRE